VQTCALPISVEADPAYAQAFNNLVVLLYESGRKKEALFELTQALSLHPDNPQLLYNTAVLYYHENDRERSAAYYRRARRSGFRGADPEFESIMRNRP
ncbi:MAG: tetratricopeptide repeat protein, partial [Candidatus Omnitrophica bacterium]|nr:tetratricopeptide repeat protein [Candidatus Omnitrophota bacterium]